MKIIQMILFEYLLGYILQGFAMMLCFYVFKLQKIDIKYLISSLVMIVVLYLTRLLPISFGIHTILDLICAFLIGVFYLKMPAFSSIKSTVMITILLIFTEVISIFVMTNALGPDKLNSMMNDSLGKAIIALPSSIIFALIIIAAYFLARKIGRKKSVKNGAAGT